LEQPRPAISFNKKQHQQTKLSSKTEAALEHGDNVACKLKTAKLPHQNHESLDCPPFSGSHRDVGAVHPQHSASWSDGGRALRPTGSILPPKK